MPAATNTSSSSLTSNPSAVSKSTHTSSPLLKPFLGATFDPTAYLNSHLPTLAIPTPAHPIVPASSLGIAAHAAKTQSQLAALAALAQQLSGTLTTLTDDVLRSGARLAYAVELLRGEARGLRDALREGLQGELAALVPGGLDAALARLEMVDADESGSEDEDGESRGSSDSEQLPKKKSTTTPGGTGTSTTTTATNPNEPPALARLRTLHLVRARLQEVITTFDAALGWPLPPSAQTSGTGFVSVAPPSDPEAKQREEQGQAAQAQLRARVTDALAVKGPEGLHKAEAVVDELRELCMVWKGTAEEKARIRFVDGLAKLVADRRREEEAKGSIGVKGSGSERAEHGGGNRNKKDKTSGSNNASASASSKASSAKDDKKGGLFGGLRRLRDEIILE